MVLLDKRPEGIGCCPHKATSLVRGWGGIIVVLQIWERLQAGDRVESYTDIDGQL